VLSSHDLLTCSNARSRGTCTNCRSIKRQEVEARALRAMRERLFDRGAFEAFCEGFTAEIELRRREHLAQRKAAKFELTAVERRQSEILKALADGYRSEAWKAELRTLDERKVALTIALTEPQLPALHPNMAEVFRQTATTLTAGLEHDKQRDAAREALRGFVDKILIPPGDGLLQVVGNLGAMLEAAAGQKMSGRQTVGYVGCGGSQPTLSAALATRGVSQRATLSKRARSTTLTSLRL
jgi:site-specific DNA recombinase